MTGGKISIKSQPKRIMFQIGYDEKELTARAELFRRCGHEVISVVDNEVASGNLRLPRADYNVVMNDSGELLSLLAAATS